MDSVQSSDSLPPQPLETAAPVEPAEATAPSATVIELDPPKQKAQKSFDSLDAILRALNEQDEQLKAMKGEVQEMLATNAALKRGIKQVVQDAAKSGELEAELQQARKKLAMLKSFINGGA